MRFIVAGMVLGLFFPFAALAMDGANVGEPRDQALQGAFAESGAAEDTARSHAASPAYRRLWTGAEHGVARGRELLMTLAGAGAHALPSARYPVEPLRDALRAAKSGEPALVANAERAMTGAFLDYARDLSTGLLEPKSVDRDLHLRRPEIDEKQLLDRVSRAATLAPVLASLAPADPAYSRLAAHLAELRALPRGAWGPPAPEGRAISPGERTARVGAIRARLILLGDHAPGGAGDADVYDLAMEASVRDFQRRHGLNEDGVIGARTMRAMNAGIHDRIGQVMVNMERLRWSNHAPDGRYIDVNQADFTVRLVDDGVTLFEERVIIGTRRHRTPEFSDKMTYLVFNPTWHVPRSIASKEILPQLQKDPDYLSKRNMRLVSRTGAPVPAPAFVDWSLYTASDFPFAIKQNPGASNSLGRVKFMFPNNLSIYLHDTPSKRLFARDARAFSHGCVRVQDPMRLAEALLAPQSDDPGALIARLLASGRETTVQLETPVAVRLDYRTAWIDEAGRAQYRADIYGRDARILAALKAMGVGSGAGS